MFPLREKYREYLIYLLLSSPLIYAILKHKNETGSFCAPRNVIKGSSVVMYMKMLTNTMFVNIPF